jgi:beta-phosphoglucomutase
MKKIKAILFDMDGVLIDAKDWHYEALNRSLGIFGFDISRYDHLVTFDGLPTRKKLEMLSKERGLPKRLHSFINEMKQQYTMEIVNSKCKPRFIHQYALSKLRNEGYKLAVCSNAISNSVETMLKNAALFPYIDFFLSNEDVKNAKPHPEIYKKAMEKYKFDPQECLVLEDNEKGIRAALDSGAHLLKIDTVDDVYYENIKSRIQKIENHD